MAIPVKTFTCPISDEYGGVFPNAFVAIFACSERSQTTMEAKPDTEEYEIDVELEGVAYKANYWYSEQTKKDGKRSRPLIIEEDGKFTCDLKVDLNNPGVIQVFNTAMAHESKILHSIQADLTSRFTQS